MITSILIPVIIGFGVLGLVAYFRKPTDIRGAMSAWKGSIPGDVKDPAKR